MRAAADVGVSERKRVRESGSQRRVVIRKGGKE